jgi:hypothetical protein
MIGTQQILNQNFNAYTTTAPLLFARKTFRSPLIWCNRTVTGTLTTLNFTGESHRSRHGGRLSLHTARGNYPLNNIDAFGAWYKTTLPVESANPIENDDISGKSLAQAYYLAMNWVARRWCAGWWCWPAIHAEDTSVVGVAWFAGRIRVQHRHCSVLNPV